MGNPERTVTASFGPMPLTVMSRSNMVFSSRVKKPNSAMVSSRTCVYTRRRTSAPTSGSAENVEMGTVTSYPTPPVSTITWFGCFSSKVPFKWAIIGGVDYCTWRGAASLSTQFAIP